MAVTALCVALLALVVAAASAYWTRRLATAEEAIAKAASDRRHDESTPRISVSMTDRTHVAFVNNGPTDLDEVRFDIVDGTVGGLRIDGEVLSSGTLGAFPIGPSRTFDAIEDDFEEGGFARLRFTCRAGLETWVVGGYFELDPATKADAAGGPWWTESAPVPRRIPDDASELKVGIVWPNHADRILERASPLR